MIESRLYGNVFLLLAFASVNQLPFGLFVHWLTLIWFFLSQFDVSKLSPEEKWRQVLSNCILSYACICNVTICMTENQYFL